MIYLNGRLHFLSSATALGTSWNTWAHKKYSDLLGAQTLTQQREEREKQKHPKIPCVVVVHFLSVPTWVPVADTENKTQKDRSNANI